MMSNGLMMLVEYIHYDVMLFIIIVVVRIDPILHSI